MSEELTKVLDELGEDDIEVSSPSLKISQQSALYDGTGLTNYNLPSPPFSSVTSKIVDQQGQVRQPEPTQQLDVLRECAEACAREAASQGRAFVNNCLKIEEDPFRFYDIGNRGRVAQIVNEVLPPSRRASLPTIHEEPEEHCTPLGKSTPTLKRPAPRQPLQKELNLRPTLISPPTINYAQVGDEPIFILSTPHLEVKAQGYEADRSALSSPPPTPPKFIPSSNSPPRYSPPMFSPNQLGYSYSTSPIFAISQPESFMPSTPTKEEHTRYLLEPNPFSDSPTQERRRSRSPRGRSRSPQSHLGSGDASPRCFCSPNPSPPILDCRAQLWQSQDMDQETSASSKSLRTACCSPPQPSSPSHSLSPVRVDDACDSCFYGNSGDSDTSPCNPLASSLALVEAENLVG